MAHLPIIYLKFLDPFNNTYNLQLYLLTSNSSDKKHKSNNWIDYYKELWHVLIPFHEWDSCDVRI